MECYENINPSQRCDQTSNCFDESDEDNCKLLFLKVNSRPCICIHIFLMLPPGQLQQENSPLQFWQSEQSEHPCEHQRLDVDHWHHQDRRSRPCVHPQVSPGAWMVSDIMFKQKQKMIWKDWLNKQHFPSFWTSDWQVRLPDQILQPEKDTITKRSRLGRCSQALDSFSCLW